MIRKSGFRFCDKNKRKRADAGKCEGRKKCHR